MIRPKLQPAPHFERIPGVTLYHQLYLVLAREMKRFNRLPTEKVLTAHYRVSRNTVRSALRKLQDEGRIESVQGRGREWVQKGP